MTAGTRSCGYTASETVRTGQKVGAYVQMVVDDEKGSKVEVEFFACSHAFQKVTPGPHTHALSWTRAGS